MADQTGRHHVPAPDALALVGRGRELGVLRGALAAALVGRGGLVLIGGEAGIGKSALAEAICADATQQGALVLVGRCYDLTETPPYGPWREVFDRAPRDDGLPVLPMAVLSPERGGEVLASQDALLTRVRDYVAALAAARPVVLLLDDLHWADPASFDLLRTLARGLADLPLLLLTTYRSDELTRRHPLYQLLPILVREARAIRLDLRPLDQEGLLELVRGRYTLPADANVRLAGYLVGRSEGNPFYAGEVLRAVAEAGILAREGDDWMLGDLAAVGVPTLLRQVIDARIDRLGEEVRGLLAVAAVIGQEVPLAVWAAVSGVGEDALFSLSERAAEARLLEPTAEGMRFAHALIREALYEGILPLRRRVLHRRVAEAIKVASAPDPDTVAYHFRQAGDARAAEWLIQAGERAIRAYAWASAATCYEAALALLEKDETSASARGWLLYRLGRMRRHADARQAVSLFEEARRLGEVAGDRALIATALCDTGAFRMALGERRQGLVELTAGVEALEALPPEEHARLNRQDALSSVADISARRGSLIMQLAAMGYLADALAMAEGYFTWAAAPAPGVAQGSSTYGDARFGQGIVLAMLGRPSEAREAFVQALAAYRAVEHHFSVGTTAGWELRLIQLPYRSDRVEDRELLALEGEQALSRARDAGVVQIAPGYARLPLLLLEGRWSEAQEVAHAMALVSHLRSHAPYALGWLARVQGDSVTAWKQVELVLPHGPTSDPGEALLPEALELQRLAVLLALDANDLDCARAWLMANDRWRAWSGSVLWRAEGMLGWSAYHHAMGDRAQAREHAERALAHAMGPRQPIALLAAHRALGELNTMEERYADATNYLTAALALADACAAPYERALCLLALADLQRAMGEHHEARASLAEARTILEPLGARPALSRADTLTTALDAMTGTAIAAPLPAGLSAREAEVLRLVAQGCSNAEIAARLFLSPRTVTTHLTAIYTKLGVENRAAATAFAIDHGLR